MKDFKVTEDNRRRVLDPEATIDGAIYQTNLAWCRLIRLRELVVLQDSAYSRRLCTDGNNRDAITTPRTDSIDEWLATSPKRFDGI